MSAHDLLFHAFALVAVAAALVSALRDDLARAVRAALVAGTAVAGLIALAGAPLPATLVGACVVAARAVLPRDEDGPGSWIDATSTSASRFRTAALVAAFFVIATRAVLIARWPLADAGPQGTALAGIPPVALAHFLVVSLLLLAIGFFAAMLRRSVAGVALGLATTMAAAVLALSAVSRLVGHADEAEWLASIVVVASATAGTALLRVAGADGGRLRSSDAASRVAGSLSTVLAGVALALLATAW